MRRSGLAFLVCSDLAVAITAVYWSTLAGLEGHLGLFAALGTYRREHLPRTPAIIAIAVASAGLAAGGTALRLIGVALGGKELLFPSSKNEICPTIRALDCFVLERHWMTSSLLVVGLS